MTPADLDAFLRRVALPPFLLGLRTRLLEPHREDPALGPTIAKELAYGARVRARLARQGWWN